MWDVFISYAWEDKVTARRLAHMLKEAGINVWYDEFTLRLGDSLRDSIDHGISQSEYGVLILSPHFFAKKWTQRELDGLLAREVDSKKVILPVWHNVTLKDIEQHSPILAGRLGVSTNDGLDIVVRKILHVIHPERSEIPQEIFKLKVVGKTRAINLLVFQVITVLRRTTYTSEERLKKTIITGLKEKIIREIYIYAVDDDGYCRAQLNLEIDWRRHLFHVKKGREFIEIDSRWEDGTTIEVDEVTKLFIEYTQHYQLKTFWDITFTQDVDKKYARKRLDFIDTEPPKWYGKIESWTSKVEEIDELMVGIWLSYRT